MKRLLSATLLLLTLMLGAQAQEVKIDAKDLAKMNEGIETLKRENKRLTDSIGNLHKTIKDLREQMAKAEKNNPLQATVDNLKSDTTRMGKELRKQAGELAKARADVKKEQESNSRAKVKTLNDSINSLHKAISQLAADTTAAASRQKVLADQLAEAQREVNELRGVREVMLKDLTAKVQAWQKQPLSQLNTDDLRSTLDMCQKFSNDFPDARRAGDLLQPLYNEAQTLADARKALDEPYDAAKVKLLAQSMKQLASRRSSETDLAEVSQLLEVYPKRVKSFNLLINEVEASVASQTSHSKALPDVNAVLNDSDWQKAMADIAVIPWLASQLSDYRKALQRDCIHPGDVPATIKALK